MFVTDMHIKVKAKIRMFPPKQLKKKKKIQPMSMMPCEMVYSSFYPDKSNYEIVVTAPIYIYIYLIH